MKTLRELSEQHNTNKLAHSYETFYEKHLSDRRNDKLSILEIGIYEGNSLRMWRDYFPNAMVYGVDIHKEHMFVHQGIITYLADQSDEQRMTMIAEHVGGFDIIIDDGSHRMDDQQSTFGFMYKHVKPGGLYFIEDLHTSFFTGDKAEAYRVTPTTTDTLTCLHAFQQLGMFISTFLTHEQCIYIEEYTELIDIDLAEDHSGGIAVLRKCRA